jgi:hypothetical protein
MLLELFEPEAQVELLLVPLLLDPHVLLAEVIAAVLVYSLNWLRKLRHCGLSNFTIFIHILFKEIHPFGV